MTEVEATVRGLVGEYQRRLDEVKTELEGKLRKLGRLEEVRRIRSQEKRFQVSGL